MAGGLADAGHRGLHRRLGLWCKAAVEADQATYAALAGETGQEVACGGPGSERSWGT
jgi:hypothetical protein